MQELLSKPLVTFTKTVGESTFICSPASRAIFPPTTSMSRPCVGPHTDGASLTGR